MQISDGFSGLLEAVAGIGAIQMGMSLAVGRVAGCRGLICVERRRQASLDLVQEARESSPQ